MSETKREKFERMFDSRFPKAIKAIQLLGNLASNDYDPDPERQRAMLSGIEDELDVLIEKYGIELLPDAEPEFEEDLSKDIGDGLKSPAYGGDEWGMVGKAYEHLIDDEFDEAQELLKQALGS